MQRFSSSSAKPYSALHKFPLSPHPQILNLPPMRKTIFIILLALTLSACSKDKSTEPEDNTVPHEERWGIYALDIASGDVDLIVSYPDEITGMDLSNSGDQFAISKKTGDNNEDNEIFVIDVDGDNLSRLTKDNFWDVYPIWSPDDSKIAFLSFRGVTLDIFTMDSNGAGLDLLYDSGSHDADIDWVGNKIVFTSFSKIWSMNDDGTGVTQITDPPRAGEQGNANLPFGDYDPRFSPDGNKIVFERLEDDFSVHGNYNIFIINPDGTGETRLTDTGYSQGLVSWSRAGDKLVYLVAAIGTEGAYDIYMMNSDGTDNRNITPAYFPVAFLCHLPVFSLDDTKIYFMGEWYE